jgi:hypothetical protein
MYVAPLSLTEAAWQHAIPLNINLILILWNTQITVLKEDPHNLLDLFLMHGSILGHNGKPSV